ncbi:MAG: GNAT family N-acetyltransferase [Clostridia bacterium]|nr:GNAT family N-acetyltransferase [Clostridia bacterium]
MIVYEDEAPLTEGFDMLFPVGVTLTAEGIRTVTAFQECRDAAEYLDGLPAEDLFAPATQEALLAMLAERLATWGYEAETATTTVYHLTDRQQIDRRVILPSSEPLMPDHGYENLTDCEPDPFGEGLLCFGTVADGRILSAASENPHAEGDTVIDIGVETAEGHEGKGYAASNVAALAYYLLDPGVTVTYIAEDDNLPSRRVAEKVGFIPHTRELRVVAYKNG